MRAFQIAAIFCVGLVGLCVAQQAVDPAYLQQYYQQIAAQAGQRAAAAHSGGHDATPIFESNADASQQYLAHAQQIRAKDNGQEQARAQQPSPQHTQAYVAPAVRQYLQQPQQIRYVQSAPQPQPQPQPQQIAYKPTPIKQVHRAPPEYQPQGKKLNQEEPEEYDSNPSYQFGFDVKDDEFTNYQNRKEVRDGNVIKGSYSVVDADGFIRTVKYTADPKEGFKAEVIREPTDIVIKFPTPAPPQQQLLQHGRPAPQQQLLQHARPAQQQYLAQAPSPVQYRQSEKSAPQPQYQY